jgi:hypothetical protein
VVAFVGLSFAIQRMPKPKPVAPKVEGKACVRDAERLRPLQIGDTTRLTIGALDFNNCTTSSARNVAWSSSDTAILEITKDGLARGKVAGVFTVRAVSDTTTLTESGFVLPPEWQARIEPDSARLRVGDSVTMVIRPFDKNGAALPKVPYSIFAPEFFDPTTRKTPIVNKSSWQSVVGPSVIVATDTGTTILMGRIGFQQVMAKLTIRPRK